MPIPITVSARSASARTAGIGGGLVAGDDQQARLAVGGLAVGGGAPGVGDAAAVRRARQVEGRGRVEVAREPGGVLGVVGDQHRALDLLLGQRR